MLIQTERMYYGKKINYLDDNCILWTTKKKYTIVRLSAKAKYETLAQLKMSSSK